jgi:hypothetical protein
MKYAAIAHLSTLLSLCSWTTAIAIRRSTTPNADDIKTAVYAWRNDTGTVSEFLNNAGGRTFANNAAYHTAAVNAYNAELDELTHKKVLDNELPASSQLKQANKTLVADGTFQSVVDRLNILQSTHYSQANAIATAVKQINFGHGRIAGRCAAVLPAIDTYFSQAAQEVEKLDGDSSLNGLQAIRPTACDTSG